MDSGSLARQLMSNGRYKEAGAVLDDLLSRNKNDDNLWYLRAVVALKLGAYKQAHEYLEWAISIRRKPEYLKTTGMAHLEVFEAEEAAEAFKTACDLDPKDCSSRFFFAISLMLLDDPRSSQELRKAVALDEKRAKQLLKNFYTMVMEKDPRISDAQKRNIMAKIGKFK